jgi:diguanylate cyclase (GGDEF)-like protein
VSVHVSDSDDVTIHRVRGSRVRKRGRWSVGAHLGAIVIGVVLVFGAVAAYSALATIRDAREDAKADAAFQAELASGAISELLATTQSEVDAVASSPAFVAVFANPAGCQLTYSNPDLFAGGHLSLVGLDGHVVCSSVVAEGAPPGETYADAPWIAELTTTEGAFVSDPFDDPLTRRSSVVIAAPVASADGEPVGAMVIGLPLDGMAAALGEQYGGPEHFEFAVTDTDGGLVLSQGTEGSRSNPLSGSGVLSGSHPVEDHGWRVVVGVSERDVLSATYALLRREALLEAGALVVALLALTVVQRRVVGPLQRLTDAVAVASDHRADVLPDVDGPAEIVRLSDQIGEMVAARDAFETELSHQALHDPLTGLPNRALLTDRLAHALTVSSDPGTVGLLLIDLDHFKLINDSLGHSAGDQVLMAVAARLAGNVSSGTTVARFGGDEFVVVCEGLTDAEDILTLAREVGALVAQSVEVVDRIVTVTASVGVAMSRHASRAEDLIREADTAMYVAKELGRDRCHQFSEGLRQQVTRRLTAENELRAALGRGELRLVYQPIVDLTSGRTVGAEALLRWDHPALGAVSPLTFIPIAEETGLIMSIGEFALEQACRQAVAWRDQGRVVRVSVNVSGQQISDADFAAVVAAMLTHTRLPADLLCLELTESVLMSDATRTISSLAELKSLGVTLSVDDFGTGYSSLAYLQQFPVDELKIDRAFVNDLTARPDQRTLVSAMVAMGKALGLHTVAEGVETTAQLNILRELGCDLAQGYLFAAPQTPRDVTALLGRATLAAS